MRSALPVLDDALRSPDPSVCPFLRREVDGVVGTPVPVPDETNGCVAMGPPRTQSARQQELVCLRASHADCPRYLRGTLLVEAPQTPRRAATVPRATLAALLVLVLSAGISFGFVLQRGGIDLPVVEGGPTPTAIGLAATPTTAPTPAAATPTLAPTPSPESTSPPTAAPTPSPTLEPTPSPTAKPTAKPTPPPTRKPTATPTSDRYRLLKPCPDRDGCWIYTVRSGDNLYSIGNYFGHSLATIYAWNPQYPGARLRVGDPIRMPPPTR